MTNKKGSEIPWWAIVLGFILYPPIGVVLFVLNLCGVRIPMDKVRETFRSTTQAPHQRRQTPPTASSSAYTGAGRQQAGTGSAAQGQAQGGPAQGGYKGSYNYGYAKPGAKAAKTPPVKKKREFGKRVWSGKLITALGGVLSFSSFIALIYELLAWGLAFPDEWVPLLGALCGGLVMIWTGIARTRFARRQRLYLGAIGQQKSVFISDLAGSVGVSEKKVIADLQKMLADGLLPMGYIDRASGRLVLTDRGYEAPAAPPEAEKAPGKEEKPEEDDDKILRQIRAVNDAIPGEEMSRKIDRIGEITKRILDYQRQNPAKAGELRQFLNYYLPTTLKLLKTYAQLDAQGVEGENITAAKGRIEGMMDKVVEGFEKQLDQLFQTDAMDIATDVEVLERMLEKDGLGSGMNLGG